MGVGRKRGKKEGRKELLFNICCTLNSEDNI